VCPLTADESRARWDSFPKGPQASMPIRAAASQHFCPNNWLAVGLTVSHALSSIRRITLIYQAKCDVRQRDENG